MIVDLARTQNLGQCGNCRQPAASHGVGAITLPSFDLASLDWRWIAGLAIAGFLIWKFMRRSGGMGSERRRQLRLARARYQMELAK